MSRSIFIAFVAGIGSLATAVCAQQYAISPLGYSPDAMDTTPTLINDSRVIVGNADVGAPVADLPFFLSTNAPATFASPPGNSEFSPQAMNAAGGVAGFLMARPQNPLPAYYTAAFYQNGQYTLLQAPDGNPRNDYRASGINNDGEIVGFERETTNQLRAITWVNGQASFLDPNPDDSSVANAINDQGWIAGSISSSSDNFSGPVVWHDGTVTDIALPSNAVFGTAIAVNNTGQTLVSYVARDGHVFANGTQGETRLLIWYQGVETLLPEFSDPIFDTDAASMNNSGVVVGSSANLAVLWEDSQIYNLNDLIAPDSGWLLTNALSINDSGDIVGYGTYQGIDTPFLLTPDGTISIPEPAMISIAAGFCLLARRRRLK
jgi:hypothetical protein